MIPAPVDQAGSTNTATDSKGDLILMNGLKWMLSRFVVTAASRRRDRREVLSMSDALSVVGKVLVVLPLDAEKRQRVLLQIFQFKADFSQWSLDLLFLGGSVPIAEDQFKGIGVIRAGIKDLNLMGLPRRHLVGRLRDSSYDLAIDLSMDSHPFIPYLLERSEIELKMGINDLGKIRNRLYNMTVRLKDADDVMRRLTITLTPICRVENV